MKRENLSECLGELENLVPSDILPQLFTSKGNIESLVKNGRTPVEIGRQRSLSRRNPGEIMSSVCYFVPPLGVKTNDIKEVGVDCGGAPYFVNEAGQWRRGLTFHVSYEQAELINSRIEKTEEQIHHGKGVTPPRR